MELNELKKMRMVARKNGDATRYSILTLLVGELETRLKGSNSSDASVEAVARKLIKSNSETLAIRPDEKLLAENAILEEFLPKQLTQDELETIIKSVASLGGANVGSVMKYLNQEYQGQFDRALAAKLAKEAL